MAKLEQKSPRDLQAFAFDADKTLTTRQKLVTAQTKTILKEFFQKVPSHPFLCTGRSWNQAQELLSLFPKESIHVFDGGGTICTTQGQVLHEELIPSSLVKEIAQLFDHDQVQFEFDHDGKTYANERRRQKYPKLLPLAALEDWSTALLCVQWIDDQVRQQVRNFTEIEVKEMTSEINGPYLDITRQGITKKQGLLRWSELTGIPLSQVAGFGDSQNDLEFLSVVGWKVAMGNSIPELKQIADVVIGDCDDNAVATYIEETFL